MRKRLPWLGAAVLLAGCAAGQTPAARPEPAARSTVPDTVAPDTGTYRPAPDALAESLLVDVRTVDATIDVQVRYATGDNFTGAPLPGYLANRVYLRREPAEALGRVQRRLRTGGLGLRVFDGYRPVRATAAMMTWADRTGRRALVDSGYIAQRSRHNLGAAVDLTLVDLETGTEVPMGTPYDTFGPAAHTANAEGRVRRYREILVRIMESEGFRNFDREWWHFSYPVDDEIAFDRVIR